MALLAVLFAGLAGHAVAADLPEPVEEAPPPVVEQPIDVGGWYIRGDVDYHKSTVRGIDYMTYTVDPCNCSVTPGSKSFDFGKLKGGFSLGGGVGYKINDYFRTDVTADYWFKSDFNGGTSDALTSSTEVSRMSALLLLANAYVDIGTWHGITPYVGHSSRSEHHRDQPRFVQLAVCLRPHGRRFLLPDRQGDPRCWLSLQPYPGRSHVRMGCQQFRTGLRSRHQHP
jgi:opacity protein-like surface antigen